MLGLRFMVAGLGFNKCFAFLVLGLRFKSATKDLQRN